MTQFPICDEPSLHCFDPPPPPVPVAPPPPPPPVVEPPVEPPVPPRPAPPPVVDPPVEPPVPWAAVPPVPLPVCIVAAPQPSTATTIAATRVVGWEIRARARNAITILSRNCRERIDHCQAR